MIAVFVTGNALKVIWIAAVTGAVGGLTSELLIARGKAKNTGAFERPGARGSRFYDIGSWAALPVGALAAIIASLLLVPGVIFRAGTDTKDIQLAQLVLVSAVAGLAGAAFLTAVQERFAALAKTEAFGAQLDSAVATLDAIHATGQAAAEGRDTAVEAVTATVNEAEDRVPATVHAAVTGDASPDPQQDHVAFLMADRQVVARRPWTASERTERVASVVRAVSAVDRMADLAGTAAATLRDHRAALDD